MVRGRVDGDISAVTDLVHQVRATDGYPPYLPPDVAQFVAPSYEVGSWVAVGDDEDVLGHIALHDASVDPVLATASAATGLKAQKLAVVARLLVATAARRRGIAARLLSTATEAAHHRGQRPVLDVWDRLGGAIAFYESMGWVCADQLTFNFPNAEPVLTLVYIGPAPTR